MADPRSETGSRTEAVRTKLDPEMYQRLASLAKLYGMPVSTYAAMAISEFVVNKEKQFEQSKRTADILAHTLAKQLGPEFVKFMQDPEAVQEATRAASAAWAGQGAPEGATGAQGD